MDWLAHEELQAEWNARYDYIAELAAEHRDDCAGDEYDDQPPYLRGSAFWSFCPCHDDGIPF